MALDQVTVTETKTGTTRRYRGRHNGQIVVLVVGQIPADWAEMEVFHDDQDRTLYCLGRDPGNDNVLAHRWTPNHNQQQITKAVPGNDSLVDVLPTLLADFPADTPQEFNLPGQ